MPYKLVFKDICGYGENCQYCGQSRCGGCMIPLTAEITVGTVLKNLNLESNNTLFSDDRRIQGKELQIEVIWHQDINP